QPPVGSDASRPRARYNRTPRPRSGRRSDPLVCVSWGRPAAVPGTAGRQAKDCTAGDAIRPRLNVLDGPGGEKGSPTYAPCHFTNIIPSAATSDRGKLNQKVHVRPTRGRTAPPAPRIRPNGLTGLGDTAAPEWQGCHFGKVAIWQPCHFDFTPRLNSWIVRESECHTKAVTVGILAPCQTVSPPARRSARRGS